MDSKLVLMEASALSTRVKITSLTQEIIRRMTRCDLRTTPLERAEIITRFMMMMSRSGYNRRTRRIVAEAGIKGYNRMVLEE